MAEDLLFQAIKSIAGGLAWQGVKKVWQIILNEYTKKRATTKQPRCKADLPML